MLRYNYIEGSTVPVAIHELDSNIENVPPLNAVKDTVRVSLKNHISRVTLISYLPISLSICSASSMCTGMLLQSSILSRIT